MKFWDTSALVPLLVQEPSSAGIDAVLSDDRMIVVWWAAIVECGSAISRLQREGAFDPAGAQAATARLRRLSSSWIEVPATDQVREQAMRMLRIHSLRAADALHLAAALVASDFKPASLDFVTLDQRQAESADREGFRVIGIG